jgi:CPA2 family monovalent cation:H+ antiporter-2
MDDGLTQLFLASAVTTMALTPLLALLAPRLAAAVTRRTPGTRPTAEEAESLDALGDHVVIVGFGLNGRNLARVLRGTGIGYVVLEVNPETVAAASRHGEPIRYGDASRPEVLEHAGIARARVLVVAISDAAATRGVVDVARRLNPRMHVLVRTRFVQEVPALYDLGASEVIPEEFETSVEIFARVLHRYLIPRERIEACVAEIRREGYEMLRGDVGRPLGVDDFLSGAALEVIEVQPGSAVAGRTIAESALRADSGVTVLGIRRAQTFRPNPPASERFEPGDHVLLLGDPDLLAAAATRFLPAG